MPAHRPRALHTRRAEWVGGAVKIELRLDGGYRPISCKPVQVEGKCRLGNEKVRPQ